jgi:hypothetical protein
MWLMSDKSQLVATALAEHRIRIMGRQATFGADSR